MKHAICVVGYGNSSAVLQETINILDDSDIDFFIHWDKRYALPTLYSNNSNIYYINNRVAVKWGGQSQIIATIKLLECVQHTQIYNYVHLISCNDIPLMTKEYFKSYFKDPVYLGYVDKYPYSDLKERIGFYYPGNVDFRKHHKLLKLIKLINQIFRVNRIKGKGTSFSKGVNWFSIQYQYINKILNFDNSVFMHGYCADELFIQTILNSFKNEQLSKDIDDNVQAARYIDWERGIPYIFTLDDILELSQKVNTKFAFARKVVDYKVPKKIFNI